MADFADTFYDMKWMFVWRTDRFDFLTSDNPFFYIVPGEKPHPIYGSGGLADKSVEVSLPLTRDVCAFGGWVDRPEKHIEANHELVKGLNHRTVCAAKRFVFGARNDDALLRLVLKYKESSPKLVVN